jgi:hypothetical protein
MSNRIPTLHKAQIKLYQSPLKVLIIYTFCNDMKYFFLAPTLEHRADFSVS